MIKNLIVNGCSYTSDVNGRTWATVLKDHLQINTYHNLAASGAGNHYICNSTISFLENNAFLPEETLILIMWSGTGRKDLTISGEWWFHLQNTYGWGAKTQNEEYYLFSGGLSNSWTQHKQVASIFRPLYKVSDPLSLTQDSLMYFKYLESYLMSRKYRFKFTNFCNCWTENQESSVNGDYTIGHFCKDLKIYQNFDFSNWWFVNDQHDTLSEYTIALNEMDQTFHPSQSAHQQFATNYVIPLVEQIHM